MVIGIDPKKARLYVCKSDRELSADEQTVWHLRTLKCKESAQLQDDAVFFQQGTDRTVVRSGSTRLKVLVMGIVSVDNFYCNGSTLEWSASSPESRKLDFLDHVPQEIRDELAVEIESGTVLSEEEAGKSTPPPTESSTVG